MFTWVSRVTLSGQEYDPDDLRLIFNLIDENQDLELDINEIYKFRVRDHAQG